jgi:hypothetical protein
MRAFGRIVQWSFAEFIKDVRLMTIIQKSRYRFNVAVLGGKV